MATGTHAHLPHRTAITQTWNAYELELVSYQNKVRLLKGWDTLFAKLEDNLSSLNTMKQSPYYKNVREFQEEGTRWEEKLSQVQATFDAWVDVQRPEQLLTASHDGTVKLWCAPGG